MILLPATCEDQLAMPPYVMNIHLNGIVPIARHLALDDLMGSSGGPVTLRLVATTSASWPPSAGRSAVADPRKETE